METPEWITARAVDDAFNLYQNDLVNEQISSTFFGSVKDKLDHQGLKDIVVMKPDSTAGTSLARALSSILRGFLYAGRITLYRPFFSEFDIAIGPDKLGRTKGLNMRQRRALVLLHEMTHVTRRYVDHFQFLGQHYFDEAIYDQCTINERLYNACKTSKAFKLKDQA